jgi:hypothetical protein
VNLNITKYEALLARDAILAEIDNINNSNILKKEVKNIMINDLNNTFDKINNQLTSENI